MLAARTSLSRTQLQGLSPLPLTVFVVCLSISSCPAAPSSGSTGCGHTENENVVSCGNRTYPEDSFDRACCRLVGKDYHEGGEAYVIKKTCNKTGFTTSSKEPCGSGQYDVRFQGCCGTVPFDLYSEKCCIGSPPMKVSRETVCCGGKVLSPNEICCCLAGFFMHLPISKSDPTHNSCCVDTSDMSDPQKEKDKIQTYNNATHNCRYDGSVVPTFTKPSASTPQGRISSGPISSMSASLIALSPIVMFFHIC